MQPFTSRQLYIMNGGNKLFIYKDGFGDVYEATPEEEAAWAQEVVAAALEKIETANNSSELESAIENLRFHDYERLEALLRIKCTDATPVRKAAFDKALSRMGRSAPGPTHT